MSDAAKKDKAGELDRRARELQGLFVQLQKDLSDRERDATKGIFDRMAASSSARSPRPTGSPMVLENDSGSSTRPAALDLTNELIRKYNARHPAAPAARRSPPRSRAAAAAKK